MRWRVPALAAVGATTLVAGYFWYALLSPFGYAAPTTPPEIGPGTHAVFVYGTLRFASIRWLVIRSTADTTPAVLPGYRRDGLDIEPQADSEVRGFVVEVDADALRRLDRYERLGIRYDRVRVTLADGEQAWAYRRLVNDER
ncbi:MAG: gamma-glutamylcyclotransferase [Xanthomonadaceae bacterium]|nr:gamma-glutamylcyclotransferase [Xanthomonadaceae bacterium]